MVSSPNKYVHPVGEYPGMTLRDYFAGQALIALAIQYKDVRLSAGALAHDAYRIADAMIHESSKEN